MTAPAWGRVAAASVACGTALAFASVARADCVEPAMTDCASAPPGLENLVPDLDTLKTPSSPALALVGGAPVDIERPSTATGAAASLATGIVHGLFVPGTTTAVEVMPYWLWPHPLLTSQDVESTRGWSFLHDWSFSFAAAPGADPAKPAMSSTTTSGSTTAPAMPANPAALMSLGARTTIWPGSPSPPALACMARIQEFMKGDVALRNTDEAAFKATWTKVNAPPKRIQLPQPPSDAKDAAFNQWKIDMTAVNNAAGNDAPDLPQPPPDADKAAFDQWSIDKAAAPKVGAVNSAANQEYIKRYTAALAGWEKDWLAAHGVPEDVTACSKVIDHRIGFVASIAGAALISAPGGDFSQFHQGGTAGATGWFTAGYSWLIGTSSPWSLSGLGALRVRYQEIVDTSTHFTAADLGARAVAAFGRWGFSIQAMRLGNGATGFGTGSAWQGGAAIDYHLKSGYWLTATAGSTDLSNINSWSTLTTLVNLQYNVSRDRLIAADSAAVVATPGDAP